MQRGKLIVISAPSGSGKTTIAKDILQRNPSLAFSVSATTRPKRHDEVEGKDYYFLSEKEFTQRANNGEFVEWEQVYPGRFYGTLREEVERLRSSGRDVLFDLDVKGGLSIKRLYPDACLIFIRPPDMATLRRRLEGRKTESAQTINGRLERAAMELELGKEFEYQVINDVLQKAIDDVQHIVSEQLQHQVKE